MYILYRIRNKINNKSYIGFTIQSLKERWYSHLRAAKNGATTYLHRAIRKDGKENFSIEVLAWGDNHFDGLNIGEPLLIELFSPEYNITKGGQGSLGTTHTEEWKRSQSIQKKGIKFGPGYIRTKEQNIKASIHQLGNKNSLGARYTRPAQSKRQLGVKQPKSECPHCNKVGGNRAMKQWHFDNCQSKARVV